MTHADCLASLVLNAATVHAVAAFFCPENVYMQ